MKKNRVFTVFFLASAISCTTVSVNTADEDAGKNNNTGIIEDEIIVEKNDSGIINVHRKGALQSNFHVGCVDMVDIKNLYTPADLYPAAKRCLNDEDFNRAAEIFLFANLYANYDPLRMRDRHANQAKAVLRQKNFSGLKRSTINRWKKFMQTTYAKGSVEHTAFCIEARQIGHPRYRPDYMMLHTLSAFSSGFDLDRALIKDFDENEIWEKLLVASGCKPISD